MLKKRFPEPFFIHGGINYGQTQGLIYYIILKIFKLLLNIG